MNNNDKQNSNFENRNLLFINLNNKQIVWVKYLKVFCMLQVFFLHYCAGHDLNCYVWLFRGAVPTFILISAYLYGIKNEMQNRIFGFGFLKRRVIKLSVPYYIFLFCVFVFWCASNPGHIAHYIESLIFELLYLTDFGNVVEPLPNCGHLYFLQLIMMCYLLLFILNQANILKRGLIIFQNEWIVTLLFIILVASGLVFKKLYLIVILFYLLVYYNANRIRKVSNKINTGVLFLLLVTSYIVYFLIKTKTGAYPSFLFQIWGYVIGILSLLFFEKCFGNVLENRILTFFSLILMEFYLIHHLFVFDLPIYVSLPLTVLLSFVLNKVSILVQKKYLL